MACKFVCDGCGKEKPGYYNGRDWFKPRSWFAKNVDDETCIHACSRECIEKASSKNNTHNVVLPI